jgi:hypothetical protein
MQTTAVLFNSISVGLGAMLVGLGTMISLAIHIREDRRAVAAHAVIAARQEMVLRNDIEQTGQIIQRTTSLEVSVNGRMDELLRLTRAVALAEGIEIGKLETLEQKT